MTIRLAMLLSLICLAGPAAGQDAFRGLRAGSCAVYERALLLYDRPTILVGEIRVGLEAYDRSRSLQPNQASVVPEAHRFCSKGSFDAAGMADAALSDSLRDFQVIVRVDEHGPSPVRIVAHAPELALWAGRPLVQVAMLDWQAGAMADLPRQIQPALAAAAAFAESIAAFHRGDRGHAIEARPPPDALPGLPRAWLSGIPITADATGFLNFNTSEKFDDPPSQGGKRQIELLRAVAQGTVSPASALKLSVPANDVRCSYGEAEDVEEIQWAGFVSGFWRAPNLGGTTVHKDARLDELTPVLAASRTCFAAPLYRMLDGWTGRLSVGAFLDRLDTLVDATLTRAPQASERRRIARELVATATALARLSFEEGEDGAFDDNLRGSDWRGRCTGPEPVLADPAVGLVEAIEPDPASPLRLVLGLVRMLEANRPALTRDEVSAMIVPGTSGWLRAQSALNDLLSELAGELEPEAETALRAALSAADEQDRISEILDTLLYANDAAFDATADDLVVELDSLPRQSDLAHALLGASLAGDLAAFVQSSDFRSADPIFRRAYKRLGKLIPWIADQDRLDILYGTSNENALRVAGIDLLNLYYSMSLADLMGGSPQAELFRPADDAPGFLFPDHRRNPWLLFAPDVGSLPELPLPQRTGERIDALPLLVLSATVHAAMNDGLFQTGAMMIPEDPDPRPYLPPVAVAFDLLYQKITRRGETPNPLAYSPSDGAVRMLAEMTAAMDRQANGDEILPLPTNMAEAELSDWLTLARYAWDNGLGAYVETAMAASGNDRLAAVFNEWNSAAQLAVALFDPARSDGEAVARIVRAKLMEGPDWPEPLRRIAARLALELVEGERGRLILDRAANRAEILAEFDRLVDLETRQRLFDAGFLPAVLAGLPLRFAFLSQDAGGFNEIEEADLAEAMFAELVRFDFTAAATDGPLRDAAEILLVVAQGLDTADALPEGLQRFLDSELGEYVRAVLAHVKTLTGRVEPSTEARTVAGLAVLRLTGEPDDVSADADWDHRMALDLDRMAGVCPEVSPTLLPWASLLSSGPTGGGDVENGLHRLRTLVAFGDNFRVPYVSVKLSILNAGLELFLDPGLPFVLSQVPVGGMTMNMSFSADTDTPWHIASSVGVMSKPGTGSPAFAQALAMAEAAADTGDPAVLGDILVRLETVAFGGAPFAEDETSPIAAPLTEANQDGIFGVPVPKPYWLTDRAGAMPRADFRLLHLAAQADRQSMPALARRIAGLSVALAMERAIAPPNAPDDWVTPDEPPSEVASVEELEAAEERRVREAVLSEMPYGIYPGGIQVARRIAAGTDGVPSGFAQWILCDGHLAWPEGPDCATLPGFTRSSLPEQDRLAPPLERLPPCESAAQAALGPLGETRRAGDYAACLHGIMALDHMALTHLTGAAAKSRLAAQADLGIAPLALFRDADGLAETVRQAASRSDTSEYARIFEQAATLSIGIGDADLARLYALLKLLGLAAIPATAELDPASRAAAGDLASSGFDSRIQDALSRLAEDGARIELQDRQLSRAVLDQFLLTP